jgi:hypothetical protein
MKKYGYNLEATHGAIIFEQGSKAATYQRLNSAETPGMVVGSSEWGWIEEDNARRICAALEFFSETSTDEIERLARERFAPESTDDVPRAEQPET